MLSRVEKKTILKRLHYVQGQLRGIEKMIVDDRPLNDIFAQLKAAEEGIRKAVHDVFEEQLKKRLAEILSERLAACPGNCSDAERLRFTRQQFSQQDLKGIIESLTWLAPSSGEKKPAATHQQPFVGHPKQEAAPCLLLSRVWESRLSSPSHTHAVFLVILSEQQWQRLSTRR